MAKKMFFPRKNLESMWKQFENKKETTWTGCGNDVERMWNLYEMEMKSKFLYVTTFLRVFFGITNLKNMGKI